MLSVRSRLGIPRYGPNGSGSWQSILSSKAVRAAIALILLSALLIALFQYRAPVLQPTGESTSPAQQAAENLAQAISDGVNSVQAPNKGRLHLLIPATSSNPDL